MSKSAKQQIAIQIETDVTRSIRQHGRSQMQKEVCGVLIGSSRDGEIVVTACIAALNAEEAGTHVTFTQDAWEHIYKIKDQSYPEDRIVGWYHTHPGFGVFLSEHDTFIHQNFFSSLDQIAWVYDPHSDEEGCFGWEDGQIARLHSIALVYPEGKVGEALVLKDRFASEADGEENWDPIPEEKQLPRRKAVSSRLQWTVRILSFLSVLVLGFALAYVLFPRVVYFPVPVDPTTGKPLLSEPTAQEAPKASTSPAMAVPPSGAKPDDSQNLSSPVEKKSEPRQ